LASTIEVALSLPSLLPGARLVHQGEGKAYAEVALEQFRQGQFGGSAAGGSRCNTAVRGSKVTFGLGVER
jgi:hypothetical protein